MTQVQKIIKYVALAFAFFLIFTIASSIMYGILTLTNIFNKDDLMENLEELKIHGESSLLEIDVSTVDVVIKKGENLKVETNNEHIEVVENENKISIKENKHGLFSNHSGSLIIYIPENFTWDGVILRSKAGSLEIEQLQTNILNLDSGAGKVQIENIFVNDIAKVNGGAGEITIQNGNIHDLDLDMGVGKLHLTSKLTGNNKIDAGVGEITLNLLGLVDDYTITVEKGLGEATINHEKVKDETIYGVGVTKVMIDGGIGSINVTFINI